MLLLVVLSVTDLSCILDVKDVSKYLSSEFVNIKFCLNEQSQLYSDAKKVFNPDKFLVIVPSTSGKIFKKRNISSSAADDAAVAAAGIIAAKVAADLKIAKAAKAAEALAKANGAKAGKIVGVYDSYFVLLFVYYISYEISITMGGIEALASFSLFHGYGYF